MIIFGREYHLLMTVQASAEISDACPNGDLSRLGEVLSADMRYSEQVKTIAKIVSALSRGYETNQKFQNPEYKCEPITEDMILALDSQAFGDVVREITTAFSTSTKTEIELKDSKKNEEEAGA